MASSKKYFHDHLILLLLSINAFLAVAGSLFILIRHSTGHGTGYIVQYRPNLGINAYQSGGVMALISFVFFMLVILGINGLLSLRLYRIHRQLAITTLSLGVLILALAVIVSNSLLWLR
jgi:hypothetical protein